MMYSRSTTMDVPIGRPFAQGLEHLLDHTKIILDTPGPTVRRRFRLPRTTRMNNLIGTCN
jgi:hypothetical protein